jgi:hypothetical protein
MPEVLLDRQRPPASGDAGSATSTTPANDNEPEPLPVIQLNGYNPASVSVGATYTDLGAIITGPTAETRHINARNAYD